MGYTFYLVLLCIVATSKAIESMEFCYDYGDESEACTRLKPDGGMEEIKQEDYYRLVANSKTFHPGGKLYIRIEGKKPGDMYVYTGFILTVTEASMPGKVVGTWREANLRKFRKINCFGIEDTAIAEANLTSKAVPVEEDVLVWTAPDSCSENGLYDLKGTVVESYKKFMTGLSVTLRCVENPVIATPADACAANYTMGHIPATSFETGFGGWWNDPATPLRWTRHKGPTPSVYTGPSSALTGDYYIYVEASYPAREGDVAILNAPLGLNGCFCIRLYCHMWTGNGTYFLLKINGETVLPHTTSSDTWVKGWQSVNDANYPLVQMIAHRGSDFRGDLALDDVEIHPGLCPEDIGGAGRPIWENVGDKGA